jgi:hypothetical protein
MLEESEWEVPVEENEEPREDIITMLRRSHVPPEAAPEQPQVDLLGMLRNGTSKPELPPMLHQPTSPPSATTASQSLFLALTSPRGDSRPSLQHTHIPVSDLETSTLPSHSPEMPSMTARQNALLAAMKSPKATSAYESTLLASPRRQGRRNSLVAKAVSSTERLGTDGEHREGLSATLKSPTRTDPSMEDHRNSLLAAMRRGRQPEVTHRDSPPATLKSPPVQNVVSKTTFGESLLATLKTPSQQKPVPSTLQKSTADKETLYKALTLPPSKVISSSIAREPSHKDSPLDTLKSSPLPNAAPVISNDVVPSNVTSHQQSLLAALKSPPRPKVAPREATPLSSTEVPSTFRDSLLARLKSPPVAKVLPTQVSKFQQGSLLKNPPPEVIAGLSPPVSPAPVETPVPRTEVQSPAELGTPASPDHKASLLSLLKGPTPSPIFGLSMKGMPAGLRSVTVLTPTSAMSSRRESPAKVEPALRTETVETENLYTALKAPATKRESPKPSPKPFVKMESPSPQRPTRRTKKEPLVEAKPGIDLKKVTLLRRSSPRSESPSVSDQRSIPSREMTPTVKEERTESPLGVEHPFKRRVSKPPATPEVPTAKDNVRGLMALLKSTPSSQTTEIESTAPQEDKMESLLRVFRSPLQPPPDTRERKLVALLERALNKEV